MSEPAPDPSKRALSRKELRTVLFALAVIVAGSAVALYSKTLGLLIFAGFVVCALGVVWRMPRAEKTRLAAALEAQKKTPLGRVNRLVELAIVLFLAALAVQWLLSQLR